MGTKIKILVAATVTGLLTFFLTNEFCPGYKVIESSSDTTKTVTEKISVNENSFSAEQVGNIKQILIDSLKEEYKFKIAAYQKYWNDSHPIQDKTEDVIESVYNDFAFVSEIDSNFVAKDSSGAVTDSMHITSTVISPEPLPESLIHLLSIAHTSFSKETEIETTIANSIIVEKKKNFIDRFQLSPSIGAGYGLIHKQFDVYAGVGFKYEFNFLSLFNGE